MATPGSPSFPNSNNPKKPQPKNKFSLRPDQNRGPTQKPDRSKTLPGARRANRAQGR